jgi:hypothetical protein
MSGQGAIAQAAGFVVAQVRVLRSIVIEDASRSVSSATVKQPERRSVRSQFVCGETLRMNAVSLQQFPEQSQSGTGIAALLNKHVQDLTEACPNFRAQQRTFS